MYVHLNTYSPNVMYICLNCIFAECDLHTYVCLNTYVFTECDLHTFEYTFIECDVNTLEYIFT